MWVAIGIVVINNGILPLLVHMALINRSAASKRNLIFMHMMKSRFLFKNYRYFFPYHHSLR